MLAGLTVPRSLARASNTNARWSLRVRKTSRGEMVTTTGGSIYGGGIAMTTQRNGNVAAAGFLAFGLTFGLLDTARAAIPGGNARIPPTNIVVRSTEGT